MKIVNTNVVGFTIVVFALHVNYSYTYHIMLNISRFVYNNEGSCTLI